MFLASISMVLIFIAANVIHQRKHQEAKDKKLEVQKSSTKYTGKANIGGPWLLYNTKGEPMTHEDFKGKYYLIYFGFTFCPDVCPVSLMKMAKAVEKVKASKEYKYFDLASIFVSLDPDRDTNQRIEEYCKIFDPSMIGLTHKSNDHPELKEILRKFKIHVSKILLTDEEEKEDLKALEAHAP
jgi:protein SCO1